MSYFLVKTKLRVEDHEKTIETIENAPTKLLAIQLAVALQMQRLCDENEDEIMDEIEQVLLLDNGSFIEDTQFWLAPVSCTPLKTVDSTINGHDVRLNIPEDCKTERTRTDLENIGAKKPFFIAIDWVYGEYEKSLESIVWAEDKDSASKEAILNACEDYTGDEEKKAELIAEIEASKPSCYLMDTSGGYKLRSIEELQSINFSADGKQHSGLVRMSQMLGYHPMHVYHYECQ